MKQKFMLLSNLLNVYGIIGSVRIGVYWYARKIGYIKKKVTSIYCRVLKRKVYFRPYSTDIYLLVDLFCRPVIEREMEYDIEEIYRHYCSLDIEGDIKCVIDAGANIGLFTLIMKNKYPSSKIICIEPDSDNFDLLVRNTREYKDVVCIKAGIWSKDTYLKIEDRGTGEWGLTVRECEEEECSCSAISIDTLYMKYDLSAVDLFKLDIEGSEYEVFKDGCLDWLRRTDSLIIEMHERIHPGVENMIINILRREGYSFFEHGEDTFFYKDMNSKE